MINKAIIELNHRRYSGENLAIFMGIGTFMPGSDTFLDSVVLAPLTQHHKANIEDFNLELRQMKRMTERETNEGTLQSFDGDKLITFATFVSKYEDAFQE